MNRKIITIAVSAIALFGMTACSQSQTPEPPVRETQTEVSTPAEAETTPVEAETTPEPTQRPRPPRPEPVGEFSFAPEVINEMDENGAVWQLQGSEFDLTNARFDLPADAITLWGEEKAKLANLVAMEAVFAGNFLISSFEEGSEIPIARYEAVTDLMTPERAESFKDIVQNRNDLGWVHGIAPEAAFSRGQASYEGFVVFFTKDSKPEVIWDGTWTTELVSNPEIYNDSETRFVLTLTYDIIFSGEDKDGNPASLVETRTQWLAMLPAGDTWQLDLWGFGSEVSRG